VRGVVGEMIAVNLGFNVGQGGLANLGLGNIGIPGLAGPAASNQGPPPMEIL